nr:F-box incomplete domain containing protein [Pandoravirus belohorizontensis]
MQRFYDLLDDDGYNSNGDADGERMELEVYDGDRDEEGDEKAAGDGLLSLPYEMIATIMDYVPPSSLIEAGRASRAMRNVTRDALYRARRDARTRLCPDAPTCQRALACAVVLDEIDDLEAVLLADVVGPAFRVPESDIANMVRLADPSGPVPSGPMSPWYALSPDSTPLALAVKAGSADAVRLLARAGVAPGDTPTRLITAAIMSGGDTVHYDACGYRGSVPYPTVAVVDALIEAFPGPPRAASAWWTEQPPFTSLEIRANQLADGRAAIAPADAEAVLDGVADALGIRRDDLISVAAVGADSPPGTDPMASPVVVEGLLRFAAAMNLLDVVAVSRALIDAGYVPDAEVQRLMGVVRNWVLPVSMMFGGNLSGGWSMLGGRGPVPQFTARALNAAGPARAIFGGDPLALPGEMDQQSQGLTGAPTPERVAKLLVDVALWMVYNEPRA